nr:hypothetical protein [Mesorhizobium sp.]
MMRATVMRRGGAAALALASLCCGAFADDAPERWRFGDGESGQATAALLATNKLSAGGGALSYSPILTIACDPGGEPHWREWLWINDKISADEAVTVRVTIDSDSFNERWAVRRGGKVLFRAGADGVAALASAGRLSVSWRFGFLSGRGEADFDLTGVRQAVGRIADACGTVPPS